MNKSKRVIRKRQQKKNNRKSNKKSNRKGSKKLKNVKKQKGGEEALVQEALHQNDNYSISFTGTKKATTSWGREKERKFTILKQDDKVIVKTQDINSGNNHKTYNIIEAKMRGPYSIVLITDSGEMVINSIKNTSCSKNVDNTLRNIYSNGNNKDQKNVETEWTNGNNVCFNLAITNVTSGGPIYLVTAINAMINPENYMPPTTEYTSQSNNDEILELNTPTGRTLAPRRPEIKRRTPLS